MPIIPGSLDVIYLDHNATTPPDPEVVDAMIPYLREQFGNPASIANPHGRRARDAVEAARAEVAALLGADPAEIVFTSCATESNNHAVKGAAWTLRERGRRIVTSAIEHRSVLESCRWLEREGFEIFEVGVDGEGRVDPDAVASAIDAQTILVSIMHASGEVGTIQPIEEIGRICKARGVWFHTDATQTAGKLAIATERLGCELLTLSGHKLYGPKGVGALYIRRRRRLTPLLSGGGQENGRRSGTHNVPAIVGLGAACRIARDRMDRDAERGVRLTERLWTGLQAAITGIHLNGPLVGRLPGNLDLSFDDLDGQALLQELHGISASSGSACAAGSTEPSYVLLAMGISPERAFGSVRFGIGRGNTEREIDFAVEEIARAAARLRSLSTRIS